MTPIELLLSKNILGFGQKIVVGAIKRLWSQNNASAAAALETNLKNHEFGKSLSTKIDESLLQSLQSLKASPKLQNEIRIWVGNDLLCDDISQLFATANFSPDALTEILVRYGEATHLEHQEVAALSALWVERIYLSVSEHPELSHALQLRNEHRIESKVDAQSQDIVAIGAILGEQVQPALANLSIQLQQVQSTLAQWPRPCIETETTTPLALQSRFQRRFANYREKLTHGSVKEAESSFAELVEDLKAAGVSADRDLLFKSLLNHSSALIELGKLGEAASALDEARTLAPADLRLMRHSALLRLHTGDAEGALKLVRALREIEPDNDKHLVDEIAILASEHRLTELDALLMENPKETAEYYWALSQSALVQKKYIAAQMAARKACEHGPENEFSWMALAYSLGFEVMEHRQKDASSAISPSSDEVVQLKEAVAAAERSMEIIKRRERLQILTEVIANTMAFYAAMNEEECALKLGRELWMMGHRSQPILHNLFLLFVRNHLYEEALSVADAMAAAGQGETASLRRAQALAGLGRHEQVLVEWEAQQHLLGLNVPQDDWVEVAASAHCIAHQPERALTLLDEALARRPESVNLHLRRASVLEENGKEEDAERELKLAEEINPASPQVAVDYGNFLCQRERWNDAVIRFERVGADSVASPLFRRLLLCLFNSGAIPECHRLVSVWLDSGRPYDETVYALGARTAWISEDVPLARKLLEEIVLRGSVRDVDDRNLLSQVYIQLDEMEQAFTLLSKVVSEKPSDSAARVLLGQICSARGRHDEAVSHVISAIESSPNDIEARRVFFGIMIALPEDFALPPGCLDLHHQNIGFLAAHPSKLLQEVNLGTPEDFDFSEMQRLLDKNEEEISGLLKLTFDNSLPLGYLAEQTGTHLHDTWTACSADPSRGIFMCIGTSEEQFQQLVVARENGSVSVDLLALITLSSLGMLELLAAQCGPVLVHISILQAVVEQLRLLRDHPSSGRLGSRRGVPYFLEVNANDEIEKFERLSSLRAFLKGPSVRLVGLKVGVERNEQLKNVTRTCGKESVCPLFVAEERKATLFSDDGVLRRIAAGTLGVRGYCTQAFLRIAHERGTISDSVYEGAVIKLLKWNYHFVSCSARTLIHLYRETKGPPTEFVLSVFERLSPAGAKDPVVLRILSEFLDYLWSQPTNDLRAHRDSWSTIVWSYIAKTGPSDDCIYKWLLSLACRFTCRPASFMGAIDWACSNVSELTSIRARIVELSIRICDSLGISDSESLVFRENMRKEWKQQAKTARLLLRLRSQRQRRTAS